MPSPRVRRVSPGFTLIEVLVVIAVIAVLGAILLNVRDGVRERARMTLAEGELAAMAQALGQYRSRHGDFPWVQGTEDDALRLYRALLNRVLPNGRALVAGRPFLDSQNFQLAEAGSLEPILPEAWRRESDYVILDPWGQPYRYAYRQSASDSNWQRQGYLLLSTGPSGAAYTDRNEREDPALPATGLLDDNYFSADAATSETYDNLLAQP